MIGEFEDSELRRALEEIKAIRPLSKSSLQDVNTWLKSREEDRKKNAAWIGTSTVTIIFVVTLVIGVIALYCRFKCQNRRQPSQNPN